jgi:hypothetical protein
VLIFAAVRNLNLIQGLYLLHIFYYNNIFSVLILYEFINSAVEHYICISVKETAVGLDLLDKSLEYFLFTKNNYS